MEDQATNTQSTITQAHTVPLGVAFLKYVVHWSAEYGLKRLILLQADGASGEGGILFKKTMEV